MSEDINTEQDLKTEKKRIPKSLKIILSIGAGLIFLSGIIGLLKNGEWALDKFAEYKYLLLNLPSFWYWFTVFCVVASFGTILYFASINKVATKKITGYSALVFVLGLFLLIGQDYDSKNNYVIVSDKFIKNDFSISSPNIENQKLSELPKLFDANHFKANTVFISTVERPVKRWSETFPKGLNLKKPVLSLQETFDNNSADIIDISLSSYVREITKFIQEIYTKKNQIRILYEYDYAISQKKLTEYFRNKNPQWITNSIIYEEDNNNLLIDKNSIIVFIGSPAGLNSFQNKILNREYSNLIAPSWLRHTINETQTKTKNYCSISSTFNKLLKSDNQTWKSLVSIVEDELVNSNNGAFQDNIRDRIIAFYAKQDEITTINF